MKKIYFILFITLSLTVSSLAQQISCKGVNTPDARFIIDDDTIILSESAGSMTFDKSWTMSKSVHKGKIKTKFGGNKRTMELQVDTKRGEAQLITIDYYTSTNDEVYVRNYNNCK